MTGSGVRLLRGDEWDEIPAEVRRRIEDGEQRIRLLRDSIRDSAHIGDMPPVSIDPAVWTPGAGVVAHAASGIWPSINGGHAIGVVVAAGPAICRDDALVRAILSHEFAHCFMIAKRIIDRLDSGAGGPLDLTTENPLDEDRENALLADARQWLGEADARLIRWGDPRLIPLAEEVAALANSRQLPLSEPPPRAHGRVIVPPEWAAHIRSLRRGEGT